MANIPAYGCTRCGLSKPRDELTVKKALFTEMGAGASTKVSRVTDWLCKTCLTEDVDFIREKFCAPRIETQLNAS